MKGFFGFLVLFFLYFCKGSNSLTCGSCMSYKSKEDCNQRLKFESCPSSSNRCLSLFYKVGPTSLWKKGCVEESKCSSKKACPLKFISCQVECCSSSRCNNGGIDRASKLTLLAAVVVALMLLFHF